jgi:hypothetical protein
MLISQILHHVGIAVTCKKELDFLRYLVMNIEPMVTEIHQWRLELNRKRRTSTDINSSAINTWVTNLHALFQQALEIVQKCSIPKYDVISRYQTSRRITSLISETSEISTEKHLKFAPLVLLRQQQTQIQMEMWRERTQPSSSTSAATSEGLAPTVGGFLIPGTAYSRTREILYNTRDAADRCKC